MARANAESITPRVLDERLAAVDAAQGSLSMLSAIVGVVASCLEDGPLDEHIPLTRRDAAACALLLRGHLIDLSKATDQLSNFALGRR